MTDDYNPTGWPTANINADAPCTKIVGWNHPATVIDAFAETWHFFHEDARIDAINRFHLPDDMDYVLPIGYRAVLGYDEKIARMVILQVMPIPEEDMERHRAWVALNEKMNARTDE